MTPLLDLHKKDLLTLCNAISGFLAISLALNKYTYAWIAVIVAIIFDWLDGKVARMKRKKGVLANEFGKELDSLADTVSFVVAPAFLLLQKFGFQVIIASIFYVIFGLMRLAYFNIKSKSGYYGLPSPIAALIIILLLNVNWSIAAVGAFVVAVAMIAPFKVRKAKH